MPKTHQWEIQNSMDAGTLIFFSRDFLRAQNMV